MLAGELTCAAAKGASIMAAALKREKNSFAVVATKVFESIGVLNKGSADLAAGEVGEDEAAETMSVVPPALNVTRVSGVAAVIASSGAAALAIFNVDKSKDSAGVVAAAYGSAGLIVSASLIAVAVILYADIRARSDRAAIGSVTTASKPTDNASAASDLKGPWEEAMKRLETVSSGLARATGDRLGYSKLWLDASSTAGMVSGLSPQSDLQDEHSRLLAAHGRVTELLEHLIGDRSAENADVGEIELLVTAMRETVNNMQSQPAVTA
jgi:hypothetical protein